MKESNFFSKMMEVSLQNVLLYESRKKGILKNLSEYIKSRNPLINIKNSTFYIGKFRKFHLWLKCSTSFTSPKILQTMLMKGTLCTPLLRITIPQFDYESIKEFHVTEKNPFLQDHFEKIFQEICRLRTLILLDDSKLLPIETTECPVCYEKLGETDKIILQCGHQFCVDCIFSWSEQSFNCPSCRVAFLVK